MSVARHGHLRLRKVHDYRFARWVSQVPLMFSEITEAAKHFPIVFPTASPQRPIALLGDAKSINRFVDEAGQWQASYLPAYLRRYPFSLMPATDEEGYYAVILDPEAPHLSTDEGESLFEGREVAKQGPVAEAMAFLRRFQKEADAVCGYFQPLVDADVLVERQLDVRSADTAARRITGFRLVDRDRLARLDDATLAEWSRSGLLEAVHAHLLSLSNFRYLTD